MWSVTMTCYGRLVSEQRGEGREGGNENRRKHSVDQSCEAPESREERLQVCCVQGASLVRYG